jgi:hypothetical protein
MTGHRSFDELRNKQPSARRAANAAATRRMLGELALAELRRARRRSQKELGRVLRIGQPAVAKLERRTDMYVSNLRRYVEALGGKLVIAAHFPDGKVRITNFEDIGSE